MDTLRLTGHRCDFGLLRLEACPPPTGLHRYRRQGAFSLVEICMAIGIVAFAFTTIVGMLPVGLTIFRKANDISVSSQIVQRVINEAQQTGFDILIEDDSGATISGTTGLKAIRYFDERGGEVIPVTSGALSSKEKSEIVYWVNTRITPATAITGRTNVKLATVTVQIANNPENGMIAFNGSSNLWSASSSFIATHFAMVSYK